MTLQVRISARAAAEVGKAVWWENNRPSASDAIAKDFEASVLLLTEQPGIGSAYEGARTPGVRRLFLGRVGYFIYYKVDVETLQVLAFWRASRGHQPVV